jgi:hypothetical protein
MNTQALLAVKQISSRNVRHKILLTDIPTIIIETIPVPHVATSGSEIPALSNVDVE